MTQIPLAVATVLALSIATAPVERPVPLQPPSVLGVRSRVRTLTPLVVRTNAHWRAVWHRAVRPDLSPPGYPPAVDFSTTMVIMLFAGESPEGTTVAIERVVERLGRLVIYFRINAATPGFIEIGSKPAAPYAISGVPRSTLPIVFVRSAAPASR